MRERDPLRTLLAPPRTTFDWLAPQPQWRNDITRAWGKAELLLRAKDSA